MEGGGRDGEILVKDYKLPAIRGMRSGDLTYSMVTIIHKTVSHMSC